MLRGVARVAFLCGALVVAGSPGSTGAQPTTPVPCAAPPAGMRAWWTADGTVQDRAGANHGTLLNGATFAPGGVGQAFSFDGVDDRFEVPDHPSLNPAQVTVEGWVRLDAIDSPGDGSRELNLVTRRNPANSSGYELVKSVDDTFVFKITSGARQPFGATSTTRVVAGRFYHLAGTYDGQAVRLYVDGVLETETLAQVTIDYGAQPLVLGGSGDPLNPRAMRGLLDEVTVYDRALSDEEVRVIHAAGAGGKCRDRDLFPPTLPGADLGVPYLVDFIVDPALALYTFRIAGGTLPPGLGVSAGFSGTPAQFGLLSGTPSEAGAFDFSVEARNADEAVSKAYTLNVFACPVPSQQIVAWYRAEGSTRDRIGANHAQTPDEAVTFAPGRVGRAFSLESPGDTVEILDAPALNPTGALTLAAWVFPTATSGGPADPVGTILGKEGFGSPGFLTQYAIGRRNDVACGSGAGIPTGNFAFVLGGREILLNDVLVWLSNLPDDCSGWVDGNAQLPLGTWSHVALTFDGARVRTYVNGVLTREIVNTDALPVTPGQLFIGTRSGRAQWVGLIDEVMLFAQALGPAEIPALIESLDVETCAGPPNHAPRLTVPGRQTNAVLDAVRLPLVARDPDLDPLTWRATGLPPGLAIDPATGVIAGTLGATAAGEHTVVAFVSDGLAETRGSFGWTVLGSNRVSIGDASVNRSATGTTTAVFAVTLSPALSAGSASLQFATADGTARAGVDYNASSGVLSFAPGQSTLTIPITVLTGTGAGPDKTFFVDLSSPGVQVGRGHGVGTIILSKTSGPVTIPVVEIIGVSDSLGIVGPVIVNLAEPIAIGDTPGAVPPAVVSFAEPVAIGDTPGAVPPAVVSFAEPVAILDTPGAVPPAVVSFAEPVAIGDTPGAMPPAIVSFAEPVAIGDTPGAVPPAVVSFAEPVAIGIRRGPCRPRSSASPNPSRSAIHRAPGHPPSSTSPNSPPSLMR